MEKLNINEIKNFTNGELLLNNNNFDIEDIVIDSKIASSKSLFVPIIGKVHDGHKFMEGAYQNGCRNFVCDSNHEFNKKDINLVEVSDTTIAFGKIAKGYKEKFSIPLIGITGSVGKTSTKDIINSVLSSKYNVVKTQGNLNNEIGIPKTLLNLNSETEVGIIEMGMDKKGEIDYLTHLVNPDIAVITNIGMSHIANFEKQEGIFEAKMEIVNGFKDEGTLIVNGDDKFLKTLKQKKHDYDLITYGFNDDNDIYCNKYEFIDDKIKFSCIYQNKEYEFILDSVAKHNIEGALASIIIGFKMNLEAKDIEKGLSNIDFSSNRLNIIRGKYNIIDDCYNACYDSVVSALAVLNNFNTRKVAILGDIFELGKYSDEVHKKIGNVVDCDVLIAIGDNAKYIKEEADKRNINAYYFKTKEEFLKEADSILIEGDTVLIKASNGMKFSEIVEALKIKK